jgi:hypothetical protein
LRSALLVVNLLVFFYLLKVVMERVREERAKGNSLAKEAFLRFFFALSRLARAVQ